MDTPILCCIIYLLAKSKYDKMVAEHYWCKIRQHKDVKIVLVFDGMPDNLSSITLPVIVDSKANTNKVYSMLCSLQKCCEIIHPNSKYYMFVAPNALVDFDKLVDYFSLPKINVPAIGGIISETDMRVKYALGGTHWMTNDIAKGLSQIKLNKRIEFTPYDILLSQLCYNFNPVIVDSPFLIINSDEDINALDRCSRVILILGKPYVIDSQIYDLLLQSISE